MHKHPVATPTRIALQCGIGELLVSIIFLSPIFFHQTFHAATPATRLLFLAPPLAFGLVLLSVTAKRLKRGIKDNRWSTSQIDSLVSSLSSNLPRFLSLLCVVAYGLNLFHSGGGPFLYFGIFFNWIWLTITTLHNVLRAPSSPSGFIQLNLRPPSNSLT